MIDWDYVYEKWVEKIVKGMSEKGVVEHIKHHVAEIDSEHKGHITLGWIVSAETLLDILKRKLNITVSHETQVKRLFEHWIKDPEHADSPPMEILDGLVKEKYLPKPLPKEYTTPSRDS